MVVGLGDVIIGLVFQTRDHVFRLGERSQKDHRNALQSRFSLYGGAKLIPTHLGHHYVANHQICRLVLKMLQGFPAVFGHMGKITSLLEQQRQLESLGGAVLGD